MKNIPLCVLDEYAKKLTFAQANKLYEHKTNKKFKKALYEGLDAPTYRLYLNAFTLANELDMNKAEFVMNLSEKHSSLMESITYKIDEDAITFSTKDHYTYSRLLNALKESGMDIRVVRDLMDEKF